MRALLYLSFLACLFLILTGLDLVRWLDRRGSHRDARGRRLAGGNASRAGSRTVKTVTEYIS